MAANKTCYLYSAFGTCRDKQNIVMDGVLNVPVGCLTYKEISTLKKELMADNDLLQLPTVISLTPMLEGGDEDAEV